MYIIMYIYNYIIVFLSFLFLEPFVFVSHVFQSSFPFLSFLPSYCNMHAPRVYYNCIVLIVDAHKCGAGCSPRITGLWLDSLNRVTNADMNKVYESAKSDLNSFECGRRGKCDYETGLCQCFTGYTGVSCNALNALV